MQLPSQKLHNTHTHTTIDHSHNQLLAMLRVVHATWHTTILSPDCEYGQFVYHRVSNYSDFRSIKDDGLKSGGLLAAQNKKPVGRPPYTDPRIYFRAGENPPDGFHVLLKVDPNTTFVYPSEGRVHPHSESPPPRRVMTLAQFGKLRPEGRCYNLHTLKPVRPITECTVYDCKHSLDSNCEVTYDGDRIPAVWLRFKTPTLKRIHFALIVADDAAHRALEVLARTTAWVIRIDASTITRRALLSMIETQHPLWIAMPMGDASLYVEKFECPLCNRSPCNQHNRMHTQAL